MVFKELEIQGFKSFPDKVRIRFDEGVTGVVGPNGSGKSTLLKMIAGELSHDAGTIDYGAHVELSYFRPAPARGAQPAQ